MAWAADGYGAAEPVIRQATALLPRRDDVQAALARVRDMIADTHRDREMLALFNREVMQRLDREAYAVVARGARGAAVGVSVSPIAAVDAAVTLWRSARMVREVAQVYGFRPTGASLLALARNAVANAAFSAAAESGRE